MANMISRLSAQGRIPRNRHSEDDIFVDPKDSNPVTEFLKNLVIIITGFTTGMLFLWFVLALFGADSEQGLVNIVYRFTSPLIAPFRGMFGLETTLGTSRFEIEALVAIILYMLLGVAVYKALEMLRQDQN